VSAPDDRLYVYCITDHQEELPAGLRGIGSDEPPVRALSANGLDAVLSDCAESEFSDCAESEFPVDRAHLMAHQAVLEALLSDGRTLLPVRYNTITHPGVEKAEAMLLGKVLGARRTELEQLMERMHQKVEVGVKVLWANMPDIFAELMDTDREVRALRARLLRGHERPRQQAIVGIGEKVKKAIEVKKRKEANTLLSRLAPLAWEYSEGKVFGDPMLLNAAFLVDTGSGVEAVQKEASAIEQESNGRLRVRCTGPLPASNFVELVIDMKDERP
jgi:hypothetical protein